jgi:hypothetical protein
VRADVTDFGFTLHDFGFTLSEGHEPGRVRRRRAGLKECRYLCSLVEAGGDVLGNIYDLFQSQLDDLLRPALQNLIDNVLQQLGDQPLAVVGRLHLHLAASLLPSLADAWPFDFLLAPSAGGLVVQAGTGGGADGAELMLDVGLRSGEHPCVPARRRGGAGVPGRAPPALTGVGVDGLPYHLGFSVSDAVVNRATRVGYRAGALCLVLDLKTLASIRAPNLDSSLLDLALPGLTALTRGPRPFMLVVELGFQAADFDLIRFREVVRAAGDVLPRVGLDVHLPHLVCRST